jgi:hypothetical protein
MSFAFTKSSRCLVHFSFVVQEGPDRRAVDRDAFTLVVDEACAPTDMTFSSMRSMRMPSMNFSTVLNSPDIHARDMISQVIEQIIKVLERMVRSQ